MFSLVIIILVALCLQHDSTHTALGKESILFSSAGNATLRITGTHPQ